MRTLLIPCVLLYLSACSNAANDSVAEPPASTSANNDRFFALLNLSQGSYVPLSASQLAKEATVIATGKLVDATDGMTIHRKFAKVHPDMPTMVVTLQVDTPIKGTKQGELVYLEFVHGGAVPTSTYASGLSNEQVTVFLSPADWMESEAVEYVDQGKGYPEGSPLYRLHTPQALLTARDGKLLQPTAPEDSLQLFTPSMDSLADIADWYRQGATALDPAPTDDTAR